MAIDQNLLNMLRCPETRTILTLADEALISQLNQAIKAGRIANRVGQKLESSIDSGLIREDGKLLYPVVQDIPIMLADDAIPLDQLGS